MVEEDAFLHTPTECEQESTLSQVLLALAATLQPWGKLDWRQKKHMKESRAKRIERTVPGACITFGHANRFLYF